MTEYSVKASPPLPPSVTPADGLFAEELASTIAYQRDPVELRRANRVHHVSRKLDFLHFTHRDRIWSAFKLVNFVYRSRIVPTKHAAIVISVRNEALNILEWIAHHRAFGFEDFFIYCNDSNDRTVELLTALAKQKICGLCCKVYA